MKGNSFYTHEEILEIGFSNVGKDILISKKASFYSPWNIKIGDHVRIDDFCLLSGDIQIGSFVHISAYNCIFGAAGVKIEDYVALSIKSTILSTSDDVSGDFFSNAAIPDRFRNITYGPIRLSKYSFIGAHSLVLPDSNFNEGSVLGASSLWLRGNAEAWSIYAGVPAKKIKARSEGVKELEAKMLASYESRL